MQVAVNRANILMSGNYLFAHMDTFASRLGRGGPPVKEKKTYDEWTSYSK